MNPEQRQMHKVFVYGTLRRGWWNHRLIEDCTTFLGEAETEDKYSLYVGSLPFVIYHYIGTLTGQPKGYTTTKSSFIKRSRHQSNFTR